MTTTVTTSNNIINNNNKLLHIIVITLVLLSYKACILEFRGPFESLFFERGWEKKAAEWTNTKRNLQHNNKQDMKMKYFGFEAKNYTATCCQETS